MPDDPFDFVARPRPRAGGRSRRARRRVVFLSIVALVLLSGGAGLWFLQQGSDPAAPDLVEPDPAPIRMDYCTASTAPSAGSPTATPAPDPEVWPAELDPEQAGNAAIIAAVATRRGLPGRAATIGIATALQESRLRNIDYGDLDSLGLFQQRPSQGWGTRKQITDPVHATNAFYDALVRVHGYRTLPITKAAQKVQRSAFPDAYAVHESSAALISATLGGRTPAGFTCVLWPSSKKPQAAGRNGLTRRAVAVRAAAAKEVGARSVRVSSPTVLRFRVPTSTGDRRAWALAAWAVARADELDVTEVRVAGRVWDRQHSTDGWTKTTARHRAEVVVRVS